MAAKDRTAVDQLLDDILSILERKSAPIADLARDLGLGYNQVYDWVKLRKSVPGGEITLQLQEWRDRHLRAPQGVDAGA